MTKFPQSRPAAQAKPKPLTPEEKQEHLARFIAQKRELFAVGILNAAVTGIGDKLDKEIGSALVHVSVDMADELIQELYIPKETAEE